MNQDVPPKDMDEHTSQKGTLIEDVGEIKLMIYRAANREAKLHIQWADNPTKNLTRLSGQASHGEKFFFEAPKGHSLDEIRLKISKQGPLEARILLYYDSQTIYGFKGQIQWDDRHGLTCDAPSKVVEIHRRQAVRFHIPRGYEVKVELDGIEGERNRVVRRLVDISETGLAFLVLSPREANLWRPGLMCKNIRFELEGTHVRIDGQVVNHSEMPPETGFKGTKIGIKFLRISDPDQDFLRTYVADKLAYDLF